MQHYSSETMVACHLKQHNICADLVYHNINIHNVIGINSIYSNRMNCPAHMNLQMSHDLSTDEDHLLCLQHTDYTQCHNPQATW